MQALQIGIGLLIIVLIFLDFLHTTLSGNGFGIFSRLVNQLLNRLILKNRNRNIFLYSGMMHLLVTVFLWLGILFLGTFIVFNAGSQLIVDQSTKIPASSIERIYYTAYVLSTMGIGDFVPGNDTGRLLTSILSFSAFILITTSLTYLLNIINTVLSKKQLSFFIATIGEDVEEMYSFFQRQKELSNLLSDAADLRQQILKNASNYLAFPMSNYFLTRDRNGALIVQLAKLYEVLSVVRLSWEEDTLQYSKVTSILRAIEIYLELGLEKSDAGTYHPEKLKTLRSFWQPLGAYYNGNEKVDKQLTAILKYSGWNWEEVYRLKAFV